MSLAPQFFLIGSGSILPVLLTILMSAYSGIGKIHQPYPISVSIKSSRAYLYCIRYQYHADILYLLPFLYMHKIPI